MDIFASCLLFRNVLPFIPVIKFLTCHHSFILYVPARLNYLSFHEDTMFVLVSWSVYVLFLSLKFILPSSCLPIHGAPTLMSPPPFTVPLGPGWDLPYNAPWVFPNFPITVLFPLSLCCRLNCVPPKYMLNS